MPHPKRKAMMVSMALALASSSAAASFLPPPPISTRILFRGGAVEDENASGPIRALGSDEEVVVKEDGTDISAVVEKDGGKDGEKERSIDVATTFDVEETDLDNMSPLEVEQVTETVEEAASPNGKVEEKEKEPMEDETKESEDPCEVATELRIKGKSLHDAGEFSGAAEIFQRAANLLAPIVQDSGEKEGKGGLLDGYITCRLHEALCHLKGGNFDACIRACSSVLQDGDPEQDEENDNGENSSWGLPASYSPAIRARAYHRRAKAKLGLEDDQGALSDARSAAFLGDRKAVTLYGRLMRENSMSSRSDSSGLSRVSSPFDSLLTPPSTSESSADSALLESLLSKSKPKDGSAPDMFSSLMGGFSPMSMLMGKGGLMGNKDGGMSMLKSFSKRLEDESTHKTICSFLKQVDDSQFKDLSRMAGVPLSDSQATRLTKLCHSVTPRAIRTTVKTSKRVIYMVKLLRRIGQVLKKYRTLIIGVVLLQWAKSAYFRPMPVNRRAAKKAAKAAIKAAMKASRPK